MSIPVTLVLGASPKPDRYSNRAIRHLLAYGHAVLAVGRRPGEVAGVPIQSDIPKDAQVDTVTMYLNAANQREWQERLLALRPRRIIFNPGAEHPAFAGRAEAAGIRTENACTLVLLATGQY